MIPTVIARSIYQGDAGVYVYDVMHNTYVSVIFPTDNSVVVNRLTQQQFYVVIFGVD